MDIKYIEYESLYNGNLTQMGKFNSETGSQAGRNSKRGKDKDKKILRGWITRILSNDKEIEKDFNSLEPKERLGIIVQLINYSLPKMRSTEITTDQDLNININREVIGGSESKN